MKKILFECLYQGRSRGKRSMSDHTTPVNRKLWLSDHHFGSMISVLNPAHVTQNKVLTEQSLTQRFP